MISFYAEKKSKFNATKCPIRHSVLYHQIACLMNAHDVPVNGNQCKAHMKKLIQQFNSEYDHSRGTGTGPQDFAYYKEFLDIFKDTVCLEPLVSVSVGKGLTMSIDGQKVLESSSGSRTRKKTSK